MRGKVGSPGLGNHQQVLKLLITHMSSSLAQQAYTALCQLVIAWTSPSSVSPRENDEDDDDEDLQNIKDRVTHLFQNYNDMPHIYKRWVSSMVDAMNVSLTIARMDTFMRCFVNCGNFMEHLEDATHMSTRDRLKKWKVGKSTGTGTLFYPLTNPLHPCNQYYFPSDTTTTTVTGGGSSVTIDPITYYQFMFDPPVNDLHNAILATPLHVLRTRSNSFWANFLPWDDVKLSLSGDELYAVRYKLHLLVTKYGGDCMPLEILNEIVQRETAGEEGCVKMRKLLFLPTI